MRAVSISSSGARDLRTSAVGATAWSAFSQLGSTALRFGIGVALARLLPPSDFGLMGMAMVLGGFARVLTDVGFGAALIQRKQLEEAQLSSVYWLNLLVGVGLTLAVAACAPLVAGFFGRPVLLPLTLLVSLEFFLGALAIVHTSLLRRALRFRTLARIEIGVVASGGAVGIAAALHGAGVWSLAYASVSGALVRVALVAGAGRWRPKLSWDRAAIRGLAGFSGGVLGFNAVNYWIRNADNVLIARFLDATALGLYSRAYMLMLMPISTITTALNSVMFPALSGIQDDHQRVASVHLRVTRAVSLVTFPMMVGLLVTAEDFVALVYGESWLVMVPILRIFCVAGMADSVGALNGNLYLSQGRSDLRFRVAMVLGAISIPLMALGLFWGLVGITVAYVTYAVAAFVPSVWIATGLVGLRLRDALSALQGTLACSLLMGAALLGTAQLLPEAVAPGLRLAAQLLVGAWVYWASVHVAGLRAYCDVWDVLRSRFRSGG
jgi:O-antigen/teichoic acid export membrane protein